MEAADPWGPFYWKVREAVQVAVKPIIEAKVEEAFPGRRASAKQSAVGLLERMLAVTES